MDRYADAIVDTTIFVLRLKHCHATGEYQAMQLGKIKVPMTRTTQMARDSLYSLMVNTQRRELSSSDLEKLLHDLLAAILQTRVSVDFIMGGPIDFILFISTLRDDGSFDPDPNHLSHTCAQFQFDLRSVHLTIARLLHEKRHTYAPPDPNQSSASTITGGDGNAGNDYSDNDDTDSQQWESDGDTDEEEMENAVKNLKVRRQRRTQPAQRSPPTGPGLTGSPHTEEQIEDAHPMVEPNDIYDEENTLLRFGIVHRIFL